MAMKIPSAHQRWWQTNPIARGFKFSGKNKEYMCVERSKMAQVRKEIERLGLSEKKNINTDPSKLKPRMSAASAFDEMDMQSYPMTEEEMSDFDADMEDG